MTRIFRLMSKLPNLGKIKPEGKSNPAEVIGNHFYIHPFFGVEYLQLILIKIWKKILFEILNWEEIFLVDPLGHREKYRDRWDIFIIYCLHPIFICKDSSFWILSLFWLYTYGRHFWGARWRAKRYESAYSRTPNPIIFFKFYKGSL